MIATNFAYHKPSADGLKRITYLREEFSSLYQVIYSQCPESTRQRATALTRLEEAAMWAIKAVVINDPDSVMEG